MTLSIVWFVIVAFFWTGFFVLEGFDFGVGALHMLVGRKNSERRVAINTIGPFWDGNEVWLIVAAAAMFAAFPNWYASWFSALYLVMWLLLAGLIIRGVSFEFRGKFDGTRWRATWSWTLTIGSVLTPFLLGVALGDLLSGLPIDEDGDYTGSFLGLFTPYGLWVGLTVLSLCLWHGATFLSIRCTGVVLDRAVDLKRRLAIPAAVLVVGFAVWTYVMASPGLAGIITLAVTVLATAIATVEAFVVPRSGRTFAATAVVIGGTVASISPACTRTC
jgi:cytochrome d ubiquinol oxidase subunit II